MTDPYDPSRYKKPIQKPPPQIRDIAEIPEDDQVAIIARQVIMGQAGSGGFFAKTSDDADRIVEKLTSRFPDLECDSVTPVHLPKGVIRFAVKVRVKAGAVRRN